MQRLPYALAAVVLAALALAAGPLQGPGYGSSQYLEGAGGSDTATLATTTLTVYTVSTATATSSTASKPPCRNESMAAAYYSAGQVYGKAFLAVCPGGGRVAVEVFYFEIGGGYVEYEGIIWAEGSPLQAYSSPLNIWLALKDGRIVQAARASGDPVNVSTRYHFKYKARIPYNLSGVLEEASRVVIEVPLTVAGSTLKPRATGDVRVNNACRLQAWVALNKTESRVDAPQGYSIVSLETPSGGAWRLRLQAFNCNGSAVVLVETYTVAGRQAQAANLAASALDWLLSHGILGGLSRGDVSGAAKALASAVHSLCGRPGTYSVVVYWNGSSWVWAEKPVILRPVTVTTKLEPSTYTSSLEASGASPTPGPRGLGGGSEGAGRGGAGAHAPPGGGSGRAGAGLSLAAGVVVGVVAAVVARLLAGRVWVRP